MLRNFDVPVHAKVCSFIGTDPRTVRAEVYISDDESAATLAKCLCFHVLPTKNLR